MGPLLNGGQVFTEGGVRRGGWEDVCSGEAKCGPDVFNVTTAEKREDKEGEGKRGSSWKNLN